MFTKLKNKIAEEVKQSPLKLSASVQQFAQAVVSPSSSSVVEPASNDHFSIGEDSEETPQNSPSKNAGFRSVELHSEATLSPSYISSGGKSRRSSTSSVASDLFPKVEASVGNAFHLQSDLESASEVEDTFGQQFEHISKEQLCAAYHKIHSRYVKYKGRYADLARHYRELDRENVKAKTILTESQDKALRRIAELKEQCQLEQKAKAHLEDALRNDLEEKDHLISALQTKIDLLKLNETKDELEYMLIDLKDNTQGNTQDGASPGENEGALKDKIQKLEVLLFNTNKQNKEHIDELNAKNQQLQQMLDDAKRISSEQLIALTEDLNLARKEITHLTETLDILHKREEDAALSLAENKLTIHRELEAKEEQIKSLRESITMLTKDKEALADKAKGLQNEVAVMCLSATPEESKNCEEERQGLIQVLKIEAENSHDEELSRGKAEAVKLLQQEMQKKLFDLENKLSEEIKKSKADAQTLQQQIKERDGQIYELQLKLESTTNTASSNASDDRDRKIASLEEKLAEKENLITQLEAKCTVLKEEHKKSLLLLKTKVNEGDTNRKSAEENLKGEDKSKEVVLKEKERMIKELERKFENEVMSKVEIERRYQETLESIKILQEKLKNANIVEEKLNTQIEEHKEKLIRIRSELEESKKKYNSMCDERKLLISTLDTSKSHIADLNNYARNLKIELTNNLTGTKNDILSIAESITEIVQTAVNEAGHLKQSIIEKESDECSLREDMTLLKKELSSKKEIQDQILEELTCCKLSLEKQLGESKGVIKKLEHDLENTLMAIEIKDKQISKLESIADHLQSELNSLKQNAEQSTEKYESYCKEKDLEILDAKKKHEDKCKMIENLESSLKSLEEKYRNCEDTCNRLEEEKERLRNSVTTLEQQYHEVNNNYTILYEEKTSLNKSVGELTGTVHHHKHQSKELLEALTETKNVNETMKDKLTKLEQIRLKAEEDLKLQQEESAKDKSRIQNLEDALHALQEHLTNEKKNLEKHLSGCKLEMQELKEKERHLKDESENTLMEREKQIAELKSGYEAEIQNLKAELQRALEHEQKLKEKEKCLKDERENTLMERDKQIEELKSGYEAEIQNLKAELQSVLEHERGVLRGKEAEIIRLLNENNKAQETLDECSEEKEKILNECAALKDMLDVQKRHSESMEKELLNSKEDGKLLQQSFEDLKSHNEKLKEAVENLKEVSKYDKDKINQYELKKTTLEKELSIAMENEESLKCELEELRQKCLNLNSEKLELVREAEILTNEIQELKEKCCSIDTGQEKNEGCAQGEESNVKERLMYQKAAQELEDSRLHIKNVLLEKDHLEKQLETALMEKTELQHRLNCEIERAVGIENGVAMELKMVELAKVQMEKHLEDVTSEKTDLEHKLNVQVETLTELKKEKEALEKQLKSLQSEKLNVEKKLNLLEDDHSQRLKQLIQEFESKLAQKEDEISDIQDSKFERKEMDESQQIREYREYIQDLQEQVHNQGEAYEQLMEQHKEDLKTKELEVNNAEIKVKNQLALHKREITESDRRWRQCLERQLAEAEARHKEEIMELSKEWHWERKNHVTNSEAEKPEELENTSQLAVAAVESGTGSIELLHRQMVAQANDLKEAKRLHKLEVAELRRLLSLRKSSGGAMTLEDACTELEYLRNILYEYMMGKEPLVLARVIAAVVKFDADQTARILQKEEQKQTLLGHLGILS